MLQHHNTYSAKAWLKLSLFLLIFFTIGQFGIQPARAATWTICESGCDFNNIQTAVDSSMVMDGDIISFTTSRDKYGAFTVANKELTFQGNQTEINASSLGTAITISGNKAVSFDDFTISNGSNNNGAGILLNNGTLVITNSIFRLNSATGSGGALYIANPGSIVQLTNVTMEENMAVTSGGAIYNNGTLNADNLTLTDNTAKDGGGLYNDGTATIENQSAIQRNIVSDSGGGLYNTASSNLTLKASDLSNNEALNGAGIFNQGNLQVTNINLGSDNVATQSGGGLYNNGTATLINSTIVQNEADIGAGIYNNNTLTANNSTLSRNTGPGNMYNANGPGLYNQSGTAILNNVTIHLTNGPSIFANGGTVEVGNTIISSSSEPACGGGGDFTSNGNNLANDQSCTFLTSAGDLQDLDPQLNSITPPGNGPTYHSPKLTSPVVDAGNPATPGSGGNACLASDQRGLARPQSQRCDIGAVEIVVYRLYMPSVTK